MTNKKRGRYFIAAGTMLLMAALSLVLYNRFKDARAEDSAAAALSELKEIIPEPHYSSPEPTPPEIPAEDNQTESEPEQQAEQSVELDGRWYIGVLEIPAIDLELPVQTGWNYHNLDIGPCRYYGSVYTKDMVVAAHNYSSFFKRIDELNSGDEIIFTALDGSQFLYEVDHTELVDGYDVDSMIGGSEYWDLTLFTCTWSGRSRVTVRASQI